MSFPHWLTLLACAGELGLAMLALLRGRKSPLALPLALLSLDLFAWNFAALAFELTHSPSWRVLDVTLSPLATPLALHFLFVFTGRRRQLRWLLWLGYLAFGGLGLVAVLGLALPWAARFAGSDDWALVHLLGIAPAMTFSAALLALHLRRSTSFPEQVRTRLLLAALVILSTFAATELLADLSVAVPRLGALGTLCACALLAVIALRFELFEHPLPALAPAYALAIAGLTTLTYFGLARLLRADAAVLLAAVLTAGFAALAITQHALARQTLARERLGQLATLGRFSAQMAHDAKNPLAAIQGAAQFLREEHAQGRLPAAHRELVDLILEQTGRVSSVVDRYQRLSRVEPRRFPVRLEALVRRLVGAQRLAAPAHVEVRAELAEALPECLLDEDLVEGVLENLLRNAFDALPAGGTVQVRTARSRLGARDAVLLEVADDGQGMDARTRERAFDDFFTTKASGSGLGLAFVRRVVEAHGGSVELWTREGEGTRVTLRFLL